MKIINSKSGITQVAIIGIIALILTVGGIAYFGLKNKSEEKMMKDETQMMDKTEGDEMMPRDENTMNETDSTMQKFEGAVLAGAAAPLLDFIKADYDAALETDKLIVLYFYANWCPICKAEFPKMEAAFNELTTDKVIGFRVNYNDNETDENEKALAREFGVAYQHTKVILKNGERVLKSPEGWSKNRYLTEINKFLTQ